MAIASTHDSPWTRCPPNIKLGTLEPGDTVSYVYQLTAEGTTHGGEQGFVAFLGDPFGEDVSRRQSHTQHERLRLGRLCQSPRRGC